MASLPEHGLTETQLAALRAEFEAGGSALDALAARFSMSRSVLSRIALRLNFGARPPPRPFQRRDAAAPPPPSGAQPAAASPIAPPVAPSGDGKAQGRKSATCEPAACEPTARKPAARKPAARKSVGRKKSRRGAKGRRPAKPLDIDAMAESLRVAAERELTEIHDRLEAGEDVERRARALASLVKTLADLARLAESRGGSAAPEAGDVGAWTLDDLDAEIERQIDFIARSEAPAAAVEAPAGSGEARDP
jgi:hypothetical protein